MKPLKTIDPIVKDNLCVRCGGCVAICKTIGALELDNNYFPVINSEVCIDCGLCLKVCPAYEINMKALKRQVFRDESSNEFFLDALDADYYVGYSNNRIIRKLGSSGGVVTQLLIYLLKSEKVNAVTVITNQVDPLNPTAKLTNSLEMVMQGIGSKYMVVPVNERLKNIDKFEGKIAFVGLPCHVQSLRLWEAFNPTVKSKIAITICLFCNHNIEKEAALYLLRRFKINVSEVESLSFRHESWPGGIAVKLKDEGWQPLHALTIKEAYNFLSKVYDCKACRYCVDFCGELADISVGDPWLRGNDGRYIFTDSRSLIIARTDTGKQELMAAQLTGSLMLKPISRSLFTKNFMSMIKTKKRRALHRISNLRKRGRLHPVNHLDPVEETFLQKLKDSLYDFTLLLYRVPIFRDAYLGFVFSKYGEHYSDLKNFFKKWKFALKSK